jgi:hypothetical protein
MDPNLCGKFGEWSEFKRRMINISMTIVTEMTRRENTFYLKFEDASQSVHLIAKTALTLFGPNFQ